MKINQYLKKSSMNSKNAVVEEITFILSVHENFTFYVS